MGIYPALQSSWADLVDALRKAAADQRQRTSATIPQDSNRRASCAVVTLLAGAALLITSFVRLSQQILDSMPKIVGLVSSRCLRGNILISRPSAFRRKKRWLRSTPSRLRKRDD